MYNKAQMKKLISIVIPAYNEEDVIPELVKRLGKTLNSLSAYTFEVIIVENGSYDTTIKKLRAARLKDKRIKILQLAKNIGTDGGLMAGLSFAKGDAVIMMNADLQDTPELLSTFLKKWEDGYEIVYGVVTKRKKTKITRKIATFFFYKFIKYTTNGLVKENASDFRLLDKKVYSMITSMPEHNKFLRGLIIWTGFKEIGVPYKRPPRAAGASKAYFTTVMGVALNGIFSFSPLPFYLPFAFSVLSFVAAFALLIFQEWGFVYYSVLFCMLFFVLGVLLEYTRRIYIEVQKRPQFIIREKIGL